MAKKSFKKSVNKVGLPIHQSSDSKSTEVEEKASSPQGIEGSPQKKSVHAKEIRYTFMITEELLDKIREVAQSKNVMIKQAMQEAIQDYIDKWTSEEKQEELRQIQEMEEKLKKLKGL